MSVAKRVTPTVYIVDDDASVKTAIRRLLTSVGLSCEVYASVPEFLERTESVPALYGCLVLDVRMPGPSGLDLQRILANSLAHALPVTRTTPRKSGRPGATRSGCQSYW